MCPGIDIGEHARRRAGMVVVDRFRPALRVDAFPADEGALLVAAVLGVVGAEARRDRPAVQGTRQFEVEIADDRAKAATLYADSRVVSCCPIGIVVVVVEQRARVLIRVAHSPHDVEYGTARHVREGDALRYSLVDALITCRGERQSGERLGALVDDKQARRVVFPIGGRRRTVRANHGDRKAGAETAVDVGAALGVIRAVDCHRR